MPVTILERARRIRDGEEPRAAEGPEYEPVYRDGTAITECWAAGRWISGRQGERISEKVTSTPEKAVDNS